MAIVTQTRRPPSSFPIDTIGRTPATVRGFGEAQDELLAKALDALEDGLIVTDGRGTILHANRAARAGFASGVLTRQHGVLGAPAPEVARRLQGAIASCFGSPKPIVLTLGEAGTRSVVRVNPYRVDSCAPKSRPDDRLVLVTIRTGTQADGLSNEVVREVFDLTPAEAKMACEVLRGDGLKACARRLGVSVNTARTHLNRVFDKTGTRRQAELVRLLLSCRH